MPTIKILNNTLQAIDGSTIQTDNDISYDYNNGQHYFYSKNGYNLIFPHSQLTALYLGGTLIPVDPDPFVNAEQISDYIYVNSGGGGGGGEPLFLAFYNARVLQTAAMVTTFDWADVKMYGKAGTLSMDGDQRYLYDEAEEAAVGFNQTDRKLYGARGIGNISYDWDLGLINDTVGDLSINADSRRLIGDSSGTPIMDWSGSGVIIRDGNGSDAIWVNDRWLRTSSNNVSIDWETKQLLGGTATLAWDSGVAYDAVSNISLDYSNRTLANSASVTILDWDNSIMNYEGGTPLINFSSANYGNLYDKSSLTSIELANRALVNTGGTTVYDWESNIMYGSLGSQALIVDSRHGFDSSGLAVSLDFSTHYDDSITGAALSSAGGTNLTTDDTIADLGQVIIK